MPPTLLAEPLVEETLKALPGWQGDQEGIWREVHLPTHLDETLRYHVDVDSAALGHAPAVEAVPGGTRFALRTEEVGGVSELDVVLASRISDLAHRLRPEEPGVAAVRQDDFEVADSTGEGTALSGAEAHDRAGDLLARR
jgi:4a-hydroxytetrahydrobiopterin dehydratase